MIEIFDFFFDRIDSLVLFFFFFFSSSIGFPPLVEERDSSWRVIEKKKKRKKEAAVERLIWITWIVDHGAVFRDNATVYRDAGSPREAIHFSGISSIQNTGFHRSPVSETLVSYPPPPPPPPPRSKLNFVNWKRSARANSLTHHKFPQIYPQNWIFPFSNIRRFLIKNFFLLFSSIRDSFFRSLRTP